jgi:hypothetical protein
MRKGSSSGSDSASIQRCLLGLRAIRTRKSGTASQRIPQTPSGHQARSLCPHARGPEDTPGRVSRALFGLRARRIWGTVSFSPACVLP